MQLYRRDPDAAEVEVVVHGIGERARMLRDGRVDLAFLQVPHDKSRWVRRRTAAAPGSGGRAPRCHRPTDRAALVPADLDGEPTSRRPGPSPEEASGPEVRDAGPLMQLVARGQMVAVVPESVRRHARPDAVCVPVLDAPKSSVLLAWPQRTGPGR